MLVVGVIFIGLLFGEPYKYTNGRLIEGKPLLPFLSRPLGEIFGDALDFILLISICLYIGGIRLICRIWQHQQMKKMEWRYLFQECAPEKWLDVIKKRIKDCNWDNRQLAKSFRIFLFNSYYYLGMLDEALACIAREEQVVTKKNWKYTFWIAYSLFLCYIEQKNEGKAYHYLKRMERIIREGKGMHRNYRESYERDLISYKVSHGNLDGAEMFYRKWLKQAKCKLYQVVWSYNLGVVLQKMHQNEEAFNAFQFVIKNGNQLELVKRARQRLMEMERTHTKKKC